MLVRVSWYSCQPPIPETFIVVPITGKQSARAIARAILTQRHRPGRAYHFDWKPDKVVSDQEEEKSRTSWLEHSQPPER